MGIKWVAKDKADSAQVAETDKSDTQVQGLTTNEPPTLVGFGKSQSDIDGEHIDKAMTIHKKGVPITKFDPASLPEVSKEVQQTADVMVNGEKVGDAVDIKLVNCIDKKMVVGETTATKQPVQLEIMTKETKSPEQYTSEIRHTTTSPSASYQSLAHVGIELSRTINLGNYESLKMQVSVQLPCDVSDIDKVYTQAKDWVDGKLTELNEEIETELKG